MKLYLIFLLLTPFFLFAETKQKEEKKPNPNQRPNPIWWNINDKAKLKEVIPKSVVILSMNDANIDDASIKSMKKNLVITVIYLNGVKITKKGLKSLSFKVPNLESIHFKDMDITNKFTTPLLRFKKLNTAGTRTTKIDDSFFNTISKCALIKKFYLAGVDELNAKSFNKLFKLKNLQQLGLQDIKKINGSISFKHKNAKNIYSIGFENCPFITDEIFTQFKNSKISHFKLIKTSLTNKSFKIIKSFKKLIYMRADFLTEENVKTLKAKHADIKIETK